MMVVIFHVGLMRLNWGEMMKIMKAHNSIVMTHMFNDKKMLDEV